MIRVATYNIRKCVGLDWRRRPERVIGVIGELQADVVALQEADRRFGERSGTLPVEELHRHTGLRAVRIEGGGARLGWHGNAVLARDGVEIRHALPLDLPSFEPRGALLVELEVDGRPLRVAAAHLGLIPADRRRQARALIEALDARPEPQPTVILGDLNEWSEREGAIEVLAARYRPAPPLASFHASRPVAPLDRIFVGPGLRIEAAGVHGRGEALRASDHLPVWATLAPEGDGEGAAPARQHAANGRPRRSLR